MSSIEIASFANPRFEAISDCDPEQGIGSDVVASFKLNGRKILEADAYTYLLVAEGDVIEIKAGQFRCRHPQTDKRFGVLLEGRKNAVIVFPSLDPIRMVSLRMQALMSESGNLWSVQARRVGTLGAPNLDLSGPFRLTKAENRVLACIAEGLSFQEIAERLFVSYETVKSHVKSIYTKTRVHSRADLLSLILSFAW
jgi:DNA-binding CsgD family transcriptional regulator